MGEPVVRTVNLQKRFGGHPVLRDVSAQAEPGDVIGVLGRNGAGKTTLLEVMLGFSPPSAGTAEVFGHDSLRLPAAVKARIGFVPQRDELIEMMTGDQQLAVAACLQRHWNGDLIDRLARSWEVARREPIWKLSVGERQKLSILLALGHEPDLIVLDEPVASLDPLARRAFLQEIWDLSAGRGATVLFSSHIVSDLERAANKVWIVKDGRLAWQGPLDTLKESVVRVHIRARRPIGAHLDLPHALSSRIEGASAVATVADWQAEARDRLAATLEADVDVETLGLEEIFMEFHA